MTREVTTGHPQRLTSCNFLSQYHFYNILISFKRLTGFLFSQILAKFEASKTGSGVGFLHLTAVGLNETERIICRNFRTLSDSIQCKYSSAYHIILKELHRDTLIHFLDGLIHVWSVGKPKINSLLRKKNAKRADSKTKKKEDGWGW